jgi:CelD/BcsL family acetyltransferase involved in cellulose biosynthesis
MTLIEFAIESRVPAKNDAPMTVSVATSFEDVGVSREEWDKFVLGVGGDLYASYDWCRIWWQHYGTDRDLRLFIFRQGTRLVGLVPMFIERTWLGPVAIRIAKRVSSDFTTAIFSLPVSPEWSERAFRELIEILIEREKCDAIWFGFLPDEDPCLESLRTLCDSSAHGPAVLSRDAPAGEHIFFHLPGNFEAYIASLNKRARQNYRRQLKHLKTTFEVEQSIVSDPADAPGAFFEFQALHTTQWKAEGKPGHFGDWPHSDAFNLDMVKQLSELGRFRMFRLSANGNVVAMQYAFTFGGNCYWRLPARAIGNDMDRFGLGTLGLMQLLEQMSREGIRRIEAGTGGHGYKMQYGGERTGFRSILVSSARRGPSLRVRLFLGISDLIHFAYYRAWRLRIAPRLPLPRTPLWRTWIRSSM